MNENPLTLQSGRSRTFWKAIGIVLSLTLAVPACNDSHESPAPNGGESAPAVGGTLRILHELPRDLDPVFVDDSYEGTIINQVYEGLVRLNKNLGVTPGLAESWIVSDHGRLYKFQLRDGVRFHNGDPVDAETVVASLSRVMSPDRPRDCLAETYLEHIIGAIDYREGRAESIKGLRALDERTVEIELDEPLSFFLSVLSMDQTRIVPVRSIEGWDELNRHPIGTGPFHYVRREEDDTVVLARNRDYWGPQAMLDSLVFKCLPEISSEMTLALLSRGEVDVSWVSSDDESALRRLGFRLTIAPELAVAFIGVNTQLPPFDKLAVRQAFAHSFDRDGLIVALDEEDLLPARCILPPGMPGYLPESKVPRYDLERARELMIEAGYSSENPAPEVVFHTSGSGQTSKWMESRWIPELAEIGLPMHLEVATWAELDRMLNAGEAQVFTLAWIADVPDPDGFLHPLFYTGESHNLFRYSDGQVDSLLTLARSLPPGPDRLETYRSVERRVLEQVTMLPLYHQRVLYAWNPAVGGIELNPFGFSLIPFSKMWFYSDAESPAAGIAENEH